MVEVLGLRASGNCRSTERVILIMSYYNSRRTKIFRDVSVAVIRRVVSACAVYYRQQSSDSASALHASRKIHSPYVGLSQCVARIFCDRVPAVVNVNRGFGADGFRDAAGLGVVNELYGVPARDLCLDETVFRIPC